MRIAIGFVLMYFFLPYVGLFMFTETEINTFGEVSKELIYHHTIYLIVIFVVFLLLKKNKKNKIVKFGKDGTALIKRIRKIILILLFLMFSIGGYKILLGVNRGELRVSLGFLGPVYELIIAYLAPSVIAYSTILYCQKVTKYNKKILFHIYLIGALIGFFTGYKSAMIMILLPGFIFLSQRLNLLNLLFLGLLGVITIVGSAIFTMGLDFKTALSFGAYRATTVASQGTVVVWNYMSNGAENPLWSLMYFFGNKITSFITGDAVNSHEFLKYSMVRDVTYQVNLYKEAALSGSMNLTVTSFGQAVYYFGVNGYWLYGLFTGVVLSKVMNKMFSKESTLISKVMSAIYFTAGFIPFISGGGVVSLFSIPLLVYMTITYTLLRYIHYKITI